MSVDPKQPLKRKISQTLPNDYHSWISDSDMKSKSTINDAPFSIRGLVPRRLENMELKKARTLQILRSKPTNLDKYLFITQIRSVDIHLYYSVLLDNLMELTPIVYTPTVGEACLKFSETHVPSFGDGLYLSISDKNHVRSILDNWFIPEAPDITVMTDGSRILGLGDLGLNGMGIPMGKLALYVAAAGIQPLKTLPIQLDMGTNTQKYLDDPNYIGEKRKRPALQETIAFLDEVVQALVDKWPNILIQFEDFSSENAFAIIDRYKKNYLCFNDDIQGTGAVILCGIINAMKCTGIPMEKHRILFYGSGSAAVGVASQIQDYIVQTSTLDENTSKNLFYLIDTKGLVTLDRGDKLPDHKKHFARREAFVSRNIKIPKTLSESIEFVKPTILVGLSTQGGVFTPEIIQRMAQFNEKPVIFPLSNPKTNSECDFKTALENTDGRVLFASGTAFPSEIHPKTKKLVTPSQGNNMYIFPGLGLGAILAKAKIVSDSMVYASAVALANSLQKEEEADGCLYPRLERIREISCKIALAVIEQAQKENIANMKEKVDEKWIKNQMYVPTTSTPTTTYIASQKSNL